MRPTPWVVFASAGMLMASLLTMWVIRVTAPGIPPTEARILALAAPGTVVPGERATAFGVLELPDTGQVWHRLDICEAATGACRSQASARLVDPEPTWVGVAGHISLDRPGEYEAVWRVFVDAGLDTPWVADEAVARFTVSEGRDAGR